LYASSTTAGAFSTSSPNAPNNIIQVAIVIHAASNGVLQVRPTIGINGAASSIINANLTNYRALVSDGGGKVAVAATTSTEIGYLSGVTSNIQTQLDNKAASSLSFLGSYHNAQVNAGVTIYGGFTLAGFNGNELSRLFVVPNNCSMKNFYVRMATAQPATGSLVFTLRKNQTDTAVVTTIAAGSALGTEANSGITTATFSAGDDCCFKVVNNASTQSGAVGNTSIMVSI
jgi:hypothetical protein